MRLIDGRSILNNAISEYSSLLKPHLTHRVNIAFHYDQSPYSLSAAVSSRSKLQYFEILGIPVRIVGLDDLTNPEFISELRSSEFEELMIYQKPFPEHIIRTITEEGCVDLDKVSWSRQFEGYSAVVEAIARLLLEFKVDDNVTVAVAGSKGRFGSQIFDLTKNELGFLATGFDIGSNLHEIKDFDIVVSAIGKRGAIRTEHLSEKNNLVADVGFAVEPGIPELYYGDVCPNAYRTPRHVTPVPGGVGPLQVLSLVERVLYCMYGEFKVSDWGISSKTSQ